MTSSSTICSIADSVVSNDCNEAYSKQAYWDERYRTEEYYDWFASVYNDSVEVVFQEIEDAAIRICHEQHSIACHRNKKKKKKKKKETNRISKESKSKAVSLNHKLQECSVPTIKVLHLGIGNSRMAEDIEKMYFNKYMTLMNAIDDNDRESNNDKTVEENTLQSKNVNVLYKLEQVAVDYSEVVIAKMKERYLGKQRTDNTSVARTQRGKWSHIHWAVADIRDLSSVRHKYGPTFDLVIDKGTMDALEASEDDKEMETNITQALRSISDCFVYSSTETNKSSEPSPSASELTKSKESKVLRERKRQNIKPGQFIQITWQVPFKRLTYTIIDESNSATKQSGKGIDKKQQCTCYAWGSNVKVCYLGDSDLYRVYTYTVMGTRKKRRVRVKRKCATEAATKTKSQLCKLVN